MIRNSIHHQVDPAASGYSLCESLFMQGCCVTGVRSCVVYGAYSEPPALFVVMRGWACRCCSIRFMGLSGSAGTWPPFAGDSAVAVSFRSSLGAVSVLRSAFGMLPPADIGMDGM